VDINTPHTVQFNQQYLINFISPVCLITRTTKLITVVCETAQQLHNSRQLRNLTAHNFHRVLSPITKSISVV